MHFASRKPSSYTNNGQCSFCSNDHFIAHCQKFGVCSVEQRKRHVQEAKLCNNCLNAHHSTDVCQSKGRCWTCNGKHHTKLHDSLANVACKTIQSEDSPQNYLSVAHAVAQTAAKFTVPRSPKILLSAIYYGVYHSTSSEWSVDNRESIVGLRSRIVVRNRACCSSTFAGKNRSHHCDFGCRKGCYSGI